MNKFIFVGSIAKDIEIKTTQTGKEMVRNTIAMNDGVDANGQRLTQFIDFVVYNQQATYLGKYAVKGSRVALQGKVVQNNYQDKNGTTHYGYLFLVQETEILSNPQPKAEPKSKKQTQNDTANIPEGQYIPNKEDFINDEDLPF